MGCQHELECCPACDTVRCKKCGRMWGHDAQPQLPQYPYVPYVPYVPVPMNPWPTAPIPLSPYQPTWGSPQYTDDPLPGQMSTTVC